MKSKPLKPSQRSIKFDPKNYQSSNLIDLQKNNLKYYKIYMVLNIL